MPETRTARGGPTEAYLAAYVGVAVLTAAAAYVLVPLNIDIGQEMGYHAPLAVKWSESAALGYTSGGEVGWTLAVAAGILARRWAAPREMPGAAVAFLPGACLGLAALLFAAVSSAPRLQGLAEDAAQGMYGSAHIDPGLTHHGTVTLIIVVNLVVYAGSSGVGYVAGGARNTGLRDAGPVALALFPAYLVGSVIVRYVAAAALAPGLFPS